jgi:hypothetical protein
MIDRIAALGRLLRWAVIHAPTMTLRQAAAISRRLYRPLWMATALLLPVILII